MTAGMEAEAFSRSTLSRCTHGHAHEDQHLGHVKPDQELFDHVAGVLSLSPDRVLFLDDNAVNVEGATAAGFTALQVRGVDEARRALVATGVLGA
jgi:glucose-1-phosphatase